MAKYAPSSIPSSVPAELQSFLVRELARISQAIEVADQVILTKRNTAPDKLFSGMVVYADGVNWQPDGVNGEGFYGYYNGSWHRLG